MPVFKIKETESVMMAYVYEVEAATKEAAIEAYTEELAGSLPQIDSYVEYGVDKESITVID